jgi:hypothetical protein
MSDLTDPDALQPTIRMCQINIGVLIMVVVTFLAIVLIVAQAGINPAPGASLPTTFTYVAVAFGLMVLVLSFVVPRINVARARRQMALKGPIAITKGRPSEPKQLYPASDTGKLAPIYQTQLIIGAAILEGGAILAASAYMVERNPIALATVIVLLGAFVARFPTADRVHTWLDRQLGLLQEERQSGL